MTFDLVPVLDRPGGEKAWMGCPNSQTAQTNARRPKDKGCQGLSSTLIITWEYKHAVNYIRGPISVANYYFSGISINLLSIIS